MAERKEALFVLSRAAANKSRIGYSGEMRPIKVFRTRAAARAFGKAKVARSNKYVYTVDRVTWGTGG